MKNYDWSGKGKNPAYTEDYQAPEKQYAGSQYGKTTEYISRRDKTQDKMAMKVRDQNYHGRYE